MRPCAVSAVYFLYKVERKELSTIDFESAEADMGYKNEKKGRKQKSN